ncbi:MAG: spermidine/putrescine ABC transporter substrate-binding protein, partial [Lachnospiraceae bacterium]|nr:spermidine/putrescine ABC transporter substrate-binding protein [Lachnospiraceae bacterium]
ANLQWSGDAVYTMDQAEEDEVYLSYAIPKEGANLWFDGWVMMKNGIEQDERKQQAAEAFVNFISRSDNVIRNMYFIGYTSTIAGEPEGPICDYIDYCYGAEDENEAVPHDISYFYGMDEGSVVMDVEPDQMHRQLYAQYPPKKDLDRCVVMRCFDNEANSRIAGMWTDIRCFSF